MDRDVDPAEDRRLVAQYLKGDGAAIRLVDGWIDVVLAEGFGALRQDWDDLRQETRFRVYRNLSRGHFHEQAAFRTYVHRIAKNVCIDSSRKAYRRRERRTADPEDAPPAPRTENADAAALARDVVSAIMHRLSSEERVLIRMVLCEHYSYREVASRLGLAEGTVKSRLSRCKRKILRRRRELLGK